MNIEIQVFWNVALCRAVNGCRM